MNKLLFPIAIVLIAVAGFFVWQAEQSHPASVITGWQTFTDSQQGITFQYPEKLSTTYITAQTWPPTVRVVSAMPTCASATRKINNRVYCVQTQSEGAAGSTYTTYNYFTPAPQGDQTVVVSFTLRFVQCANYSEPAKTACETERNSFSVDDLISQIVSTIKT